MAKSFIDLLLDDIFDAEWKGPVSYTHLDVYKRQQFYLCVGSECRQPTAEFGEVIRWLGETAADK